MVPWIHILVLVVLTSQLFLLPVPVSKRMAMELNLIDLFYRALTNITMRYFG